ncbi:NUDIX domain-containing protein [Salmonella enterica subsp. enterica serovar Infantis]|nr:NUDIX domain-containing protein [Salmonella enterica subsp. enterica serovar Infantis]
MIIDVALSASAKLPSEKKARKQSGVIPYRKKKNGTIEILLVRTTNASNWGLPKGGVEKGMTALDSAMKEAMEEAGVLGKPKDFVDIMKYVKGKTGRAQTVEWYIMKVKQILTEYDEAGMRERKWFEAEKALRKVDKKFRPIMQQALDIIDSYGI